MRLTGRNPRNHLTSVRERVAQQWEEGDTKGGRGETALIYLSNHKLAGSQCAMRRERATLFLSSVRGGTESVSVTRVCVACSTGNTIYTMQIKRVHAVRASGLGPARLACFDVLLLMFLLLYRIARFMDEEMGRRLFASDARTNIDGPPIL